MQGHKAAEYDKMKIQTHMKTLAVTAAFFALAGSACATDFNGWFSQSRTGQWCVYRDQSTYVAQTDDSRLRLRGQVALTDDSIRDLLVVMTYGDEVAINDTYRVSDERNFAVSRQLFVLNDSQTSYHYRFEDNRLVEAPEVSADFKSYVAEKPRKLSYFSRLKSLATKLAASGQSHYCQ